MNKNFVHQAGDQPRLYYNAGQPIIKICSAKQVRLIYINVLYVNKQEFCTSSWRSTKVKMCFKLRNGFYILFGRRLGFKQVTCIVGDGGNLNTVYQLQMLVRIRWSIQGHNSYRRRMKRPV